MVEIKSNVDDCLVIKSNILADNLNCLLKKHNLNANKLANILNIPMMTIRRILSGETIDPRISTLKLIADYFKISIDTLIESNNLNNAEKMSYANQYNIPLLDWDTIEKVKDIKDITLENWPKWQPISLNKDYSVSKYTFALESRPSMHPRFYLGTIFIIDPEVLPIDGDIILVRIKKNNTITLRELIIDSPEWNLSSLTSQSSVIKFSNIEHDLIGVVILTILSHYNKPH